MELHVRAEGRPDAPVIVLLHGLAVSQAMWEPQVGMLREKWHVLLPDMRGHGRSPVGDGQYMLDFFVDDLFAMLDERRIKKAVFCGLSMGGYLALRAYEREPERFRGLVLADTRAEADTNEAKLKRADAIRSVKKSGSKPFADGLMKALFAPATLNAKQDVTIAIRRMIEETSPDAIAGASLALAARTDTTHVLATITVPTLIIVGAEDVLTPPQASRAMAERIPGARLVEIAGAGHLSSWEKPREFNDALASFLRLSSSWTS